MQRSSVILSLAIIALVAALSPVAGNYLARRHVLAEASHARGLFIAMQSAAGDHRQAGAGVAYPFESGIHSTAAYLDALEKGNYLSTRDRAALRGLVLANVSENDPPETVVILSRDACEALQAGQTPRNFLVFRKGGDAASYKLGDPSFFKLPPRQPAFLTP